MNPVAKIICHSKSSVDGSEAVTFQVRYARMIHAEMMTHKTPARNGRSSRAVPVKVLLREPIVEPVIYGANRPGMQSTEPLRGWRKLLARGTWLTMAHMTRLGVRLLHFAGLHKQWANRPLEWFGAIDMVITATRFKNFFYLRIDGMAQPEIRILAEAMRDALAQSTPRVLEPGEWHLPFVEDFERGLYKLATQKKISAARCAAITFAPPVVDSSSVAAYEQQIEKELDRYIRLIENKPVHASPTEHQLTPDVKVGRGGSQRWKRGGMHGCTPGWVQHRHEIPDHFIPG